MRQGRQSGGSEPYLEGVEAIPPVLQNGHLPGQGSEGARERGMGRGREGARGRGRERGREEGSEGGRERETRGTGGTKVPRLGGDCLIVSPLFRRSLRG